MQRILSRDSASTPGLQIPRNLNPREQYECVGDVPNVVFPCAAKGRIALLEVFQDIEAIRPAGIGDERGTLPGKLIERQPGADRAFMQHIPPRQERARYRLRQNGERAVAVGDVDQKPMVRPMFSTG